MNKQASELVEKIVNMCDVSIEFYQKLKDDMLRLDQTTCSEFDVSNLFREAFKVHNTKYAKDFWKLDCDIYNILYGDLFEELQHAAAE